MRQQQIEASLAILALVLLVGIANSIGYADDLTDEAIEKLELVDRVSGGKTDEAIEPIEQVNRLSRERESDFFMFGPPRCAATADRHYQIYRGWTVGQSDGIEHPAEGGCLTRKST